MSSENFVVKTLSYKPSSAECFVDVDVKDAQTQDNYAVVANTQFHEAKPANGRVIKTLIPNSNAFSTPFIDVALDKVEFPNGAEGEYAVLSNKQPYGTVIIPMISFRGNGYFGLVNQYRYPVKQFTTEFPRGGADGLDEESARVEIREEMGQDAKRLVRLGTLHTDTGIASTEAAVWLAIMDESCLTNNHTEEITGLQPDWVQEGSLDGLIMNGGITCSTTLAAYTLFKLNRAKFGMLLSNQF